MIKVLVVEDNLATFQILQTIVKDYFSELMIVGHYTNAEDAYLYIKKNNFDWLLLDIDLDGKMNGFDLLDLIGNDISFKILFFTGSNDENIKIKAIRHNAFDFFSKPISISEISQAVTRYKSLKNIAKRTIHQENPPQDIEEGMLHINTHKKSMYLKYSDIICIIAKGAYSVIEYKGNNTLKCAKNLLRITKELKNNADFIRISRSIILNKNHIIELIKLSDRKTNVILSENKTLCISSTIKKHLLELLEKKK